MNIGQGQLRLRLLVGLLLFGNRPKLMKEAGEAVKEFQKQVSSNKEDKKKEDTKES